MNKYVIVGGPDGDRLFNGSLSDAAMLAKAIGNKSPKGTNIVVVDSDGVIQMDFVV